MQHLPMRTETKEREETEVKITSMQPHVPFVLFDAECCHGQYLTNLITNDYNVIRQSIILHC